MKLLFESVKYLLGSVIAFVIDYASLWVLTQVLEANYIASVAVSFLLGGVFLYWYSIKWVFTERSVIQRKHEISLFILIGVIGLGLNALLIMLAVEYLYWHVMLAKLMASAFTLVFNFVFRKLILFTSPKNLEVSEARAKSI